MTLTLKVANTVGEADITQVYFNLDPIFDPTTLSIARIGGDGPPRPTIGIETGADGFKAGGDGLYDIWFDLPPPGNRFEEGETLIFSIIGIATLTANSFNFLSNTAKRRRRAGAVSRRGPCPEHRFGPGRQRLDRSEATGWDCADTGRNVDVRSRARTVGRDKKEIQGDADR